jgi:hypothetical protein
VSTADDDWLAAQLREVERGEAAAATSWRIPRWLPWAGGLWVFAGFGARVAFEGSTPLTWTLLHQGVLLGYLWWDLRRTPSPRARGPQEYRVYYVVLGLLATALLLILLPTWIYVGGWTAAAVAGASCTAFGLLAQLTYDRITRTVKERLA